MKLEEMINELVKNPDKVFISNYITTKVQVIEGSIIFTDKNDYETDLKLVCACRDWQEVKEPISFMELLEELKKLHNINLKVKAVYEKFDLDRTEHFRELMSWMFSTMLLGDIADTLLNAKFYIEEE